MHAFILAYFLCFNLSFPEEARFFSSKGVSVLKSRTEETKRNTGRGLLSTAKSASGVASPLYSIPTTKTDRESSRRLLEMFDRKKNWLFHGMEGSDQDDLSANGEAINEDQRLFLDSYRKSNGIVQDFIRGEGKRSRSKKASKSDKKQKGATYLEGEEEDEDRLDKNDIKLDFAFEKKDEKSGAAFNGNSPFEARTSIMDFSPFARREQTSKNPFKTSRVRGESKVGLFGMKRETAGSVASSGMKSKGGFFNSAGDPSQSLFGKNSFFSGKGESTGKKPFAIAPLNFGSSLNPAKSTPITGVGVDQLNKTVMPNSLGAKSLTSGNPISEIISRQPSIPSKRFKPLLFQGNIQSGPPVRGGLLNNTMRSPFDKKLGGR